MSPSRFPLAILFALACFAPFPPETAAQAAARTPWKNKATVAWSGTPMRDTLGRFAEAQRFTFLLDRRIDPATLLDFQATAQPLDRILPAAADSLDLAASLQSGFAYFGPKDAVRNFENLLEERRIAMKELPARTASKYRRPLRMEWEMLCEPRAMLEDVAAKAGLRIRNPETLPYDLWDKTSLQGTPLEILAVLLVGFDLAFHWEDDGETIVLAPLPENRWAKVARAKPRPRTVAMEATTTAASPAAPEVPLNRRRFTLRVENQPLKKLLETLAERLGLTLRLDEASLAAKGVSTETNVSFEVKNAAATELFQTFLNPLKLEFRIRGDTLTVR